MTIRRPTVAMEPAVYRREHWQSFAFAPFITLRSQWSPPFIGGSTLTAIASRGRSASSQWSPPFIGGSTLTVRPPEASGKVVAMEPAVYRREHLHLEKVGPVRAPVAMEPAVYRREHAPKTSLCAADPKSSQWSP